VQLKRKAPYGEINTAESLELVMTNPDFIGGVGSPVRAPVSGKSARTYKSKAKCSKPVPQTPISNAGKFKFVVLTLITSADQHNLFHLSLFFLSNS